MVDDDPSILEAMGMLLREQGYEIATAANGFDALMQLNLATPDVIVSDLNMPRMSGYEFLSFVRRRFSSIPLIAMSGDYEADLRFPGGVIADAFFAKGRCHPEDLLRAIAALVHTSAARPISHERHAEPLQMSHYGNDSNGVPFM